ncbi:MAG: translation initiation factor IF-2 N-terminal domain-containing protein, partial [Candidatus Limivicinus sp.]
MSMIKYRIHEVAKDFNVSSKVISQILTDYVAAPKNHMQVLENHELNVIFDYMTQHNQVASLEEIFNVAPKTEPAKAAPAKQQAVQEKKQDNKAAKPAEKPAAPAAQAAAPAQQAALEKKNKPHVPRQVAEKRVVDTRGGAAVNIEKYNERYDDMAGNKANTSNMRRGNKEKIQSKSKQRPNQQAASAKRRQEERDKMNRLQLEIAKKQQLKVEIPDEIAVGELASRMKKTAAEVIKQLFKLGVFASISDVIDYDTAALVAMEMGCKVEKEV